MIKVCGVVLFCYSAWWRRERGRRGRREEDEERRRKEREEREERGKRGGVNVCGMSVCVRTYTCVGSAQGFMFEGEGSSVHFLAYRYASA